MATKLKTVVVAVCGLLLAACSAPWSSNRLPPTATSTSVIATVRESTQIVSSTPTVARTASSSTPIPTRSVSTPTEAAPTSTPRPTVAETQVSGCCGTFSWVDAKRLLVYDNPTQGQSGAWMIDATNGSRQFVAADFGIPSPSGLVAFPNKAAGTTDIRRLDGSLIATIHNGGVLTWISPNGKDVVWLEDLGVRSISSLVPRTVKLWTASIDGSGARPLLTFDAAAINWLPDNRHVIAMARAPDGSSAGIWAVDTSDGTNAVVVHGTFLQSLRLSPDGTRMAYLETFSGTSGDDGVWVSNVDGSQRTHLQESGPFRWADGSTDLWFLNLAPPAGGNDHVAKVDISHDRVSESVDLGGRVLNDEWEVNPDGNIVAYWSETNQAVMVKELAP